jgi:hypothetical protein
MTHQSKLNTTPPIYSPLPPLLHVNELSWHGQVRRSTKGFIMIHSEYQKELVRILTVADQLHSGVEKILNGPGDAEVYLLAAHVSVSLEDLQAKVEEKLDILEAQ